VALGQDVQQRRVPVVDGAAEAQRHDQRDALCGTLPAIGVGPAGDGRPVGQKGDTSRSVDLACEMPGERPRNALPCRIFGRTRRTLDDRNRAWTLYSLRRVLAREMPEERSAVDEVERSYLKGIDGDVASYGCPRWSDPSSSRKPACTSVAAT
jgi:hypothetical protein